MIAAVNPGVTAATPALSAPTAGRAPGIINDWRIGVGERPVRQRGYLVPYPWMAPMPDGDEYG